MFAFIPGKFSLKATGWLIIFWINSTHGAATTKNGIASCWQA
jgi:hypothetical protein